MLDVRDRYVLVEAHAFDDVMELAGRAASALARSSFADPLVDGLRGAIAQVRSTSVLDPDPD